MANGGIEWERKKQWSMHEEKQREYYLHKKVRSVKELCFGVCFKILSYLTVFLYSLGMLQQRGGGC